MQPPPASDGRGVSLMVLRIILGAVYTAMAVGQLASWGRMPQILDAYDALPTVAVPWLAGALVVGELVCGVWFLARPRTHALAPVWLYTGVAPNRTVREGGL